MSIDEQAKLTCFDKERTSSLYTPDEYRMCRTYDYGSLMDFVLYEKIYGFDMPDSVWDSQLFDDLLKEVVYHGALINDMTSLRKEVCNGETRNWIIIQYLTTGNI